MMQYNWDYAELAFCPVVDVAGQEDAVAADLVLDKEVDVHYEVGVVLLEHGDEVLVLGFLGELKHLRVDLLTSVVHYQSPSKVLALMFNSD